MYKVLGFTLIELLITLTILGIIAGIAYPSYQGFVIKIRRADAQSELIKAQIEQSSYRIIHPSYVNNALSAGLPSHHEYYTFSIASTSSHTYLIKAEAKNSSSQANDKRLCKVLYINQDSIKTSDGNTDNKSCWLN